MALPFAAARWAVYAAINAISAELAANGIAKARTNEVDDYKYRSIDDVLNRLAPLLAKHRLCILPKVLERSVIERADEQSRLLLHVTVHVAFALTSVEDGSSHSIEAFGEALDGGDKATAKAMSAAYKSAMVQAFCIPISGPEDTDRSSHHLAARVHCAEPLQGWSQWCLDIEDIVASCESEQAISMVRESNRDLLTGLAREQPQLYGEVGNAFLSRREALSAERQARKAPKREHGHGRTKANAGQSRDADHA